MIITTKSLWFPSGTTLLLQQAYKNKRFYWRLLQDTVNPKIDRSPDCKWRLLFCSIAISTCPGPGTHLVAAGLERLLSFPGSVQRERPGMNSSTMTASPHPGSTAATCTMSQSSGVSTPGSSGPRDRVSGQGAAAGSAAQCYLCGKE